MDTKIIYKKTNSDNQITTKCHFYPPHLKLNKCHPLLQSHDFTMTRMGLHVGEITSHIHTHRPAAPHQEELHNNLWRRSRCSRSARHKWRRAGSRWVEERLRKNGFVNGGIQLRGGFTSSVQTGRSSFQSQGVSQLFTVSLLPVSLLLVSWLGLETICVQQHIKTVQKQWYLFAICIY